MSPIIPINDAQAHQTLSHKAILFGVKIELDEAGVTFVDAGSGEPVIQIKNGMVVANQYADMTPIVGVVETGRHMGFPVHTFFVVTSSNQLLAFPTFNKDPQLVIDQIEDSVLSNGIDKFQWDDLVIKNNNFQKRFSFDESILYEVSAEIWYPKESSGHVRISSVLIPSFTGEQSYVSDINEYYLKSISLKDFEKIVLHSGENIVDTKVSAITQDEAGNFLINLVDSTDEPLSFSSLYELNNYLEGISFDWPFEKNQLIANLRIIERNELTAELVSLSDAAILNRAKKLGLVEQSTPDSKDLLIKAIVEKSINSTNKEKFLMDVGIETDTTVVTFKNPQNQLDDPKVYADVLSKWTEYFGGLGEPEYDLDEYKAEVHSLIKKGGELYRLVFLNELSDLNFEDLTGNHWTTSAHNLSEFGDNHYQHYGANKPLTLVIEASVPANSISNVGVDLAENPREREVNIIANFDSVILNIYESDSNYRRGKFLGAYDSGNRRFIEFLSPLERGFKDAQAGFSLMTAHRDVEHKPQRYKSEYESGWIAGMEKVTTELLSKDIAEGHTLAYSLGRFAGLQGHNPLPPSNLKSKVEQQEYVEAWKASAVLVTNLLKEKPSVSFGDLTAHPTVTGYNIDTLRVVWNFNARDYLTPEDALESIQLHQVHTEHFKLHLLNSIETSNINVKTEENNSSEIQDETLKGKVVMVANPYFKVTLLTEDNKDAVNFYCLNASIEEPIGDWTLRQTTTGFHIVNLFEGLVIHSPEANRLNVPEDYALVANFLSAVPSLREGILGLSFPVAKEPILNELMVTLKEAYTEKNSASEVNRYSTPLRKYDHGEYLQLLRRVKNLPDFSLNNPDDVRTIFEIVKDEQKVDLKNFLHWLYNLYFQPSNYAPVLRDYIDLVNDIHVKNITDELIGEIERENLIAYENAKWAVFIDSSTEKPFNINLEQKRAFFAAKDHVRLLGLVSTETYLFSFDDAPHLYINMGSLPYVVKLNPDGTHAERWGVEKITHFNNDDGAKFITLIETTIPEKNRKQFSVEAGLFDADIYEENNGHVDENSDSDAVLDDVFGGGSPLVFNGRDGVSNINNEKQDDLFSAPVGTVPNQGEAILIASQKEGEDPAATINTWLSGSRVVDEAGNPRILYHGTGAALTQFNGMVWGSASPDLASDYAELRMQEGGTPNIMPIYMRVKSPFDADALKTTIRVRDFFDELIKQSPQISPADLEEFYSAVIVGARTEESGPHYSPQDFWNNTNSLFGVDGANAIQLAFELAGFDGIKFHESGSLTFGAFSDSQVKSALVIDQSLIGELISEGIDQVVENISDEFVSPFGIRISDLELAPEVLAARNVLPPVSSMTPAEPTNLPLGSVRVSTFGDVDERYVDVLRKVPVDSLLIAEPEDNIKKTAAYLRYVIWAMEGREAPAIQVNENDKGELVSSNRRRALAAKEAGIKSITAWVSPINPETGEPLKYGDLSKYKLAVDIAHAESIDSAKPVEKALPDQSEFLGAMLQLGWINKGAENQKLYWVTKEIDGGHKTSNNPDGIRRLSAKLVDGDMIAKFGDGALLSVPFNTELSLQQNALNFDSAVDNLDSRAGQKNEMDVEKDAAPRVTYNSFSVRAVMEELGKLGWKVPTNSLIITKRIDGSVYGVRATQHFTDNKLTHVEWADTGGAAWSIRDNGEEAPESIALKLNSLINAPIALYQGKREVEADAIPDVSYSTDGMFTSFIPNTKDGENIFRTMAAETNGTGKVLSIHAESVINQIISAGYSVGLAADLVSPLSDDELLAELTEDTQLEAVKSALASQDWILDGGGAALATKTYKVFNGDRTATAWLSESDGWNRSLSFYFESEGRNQASTSGLLIPSDATYEQSYEIAIQAAARADVDIKNSYAVKITKHEASIEEDNEMDIPFMPQREGYFPVRLFKLNGNRGRTPISELGDVRGLEKEVVETVLGSRRATCTTWFDQNGNGFEAEEVKLKEGDDLDAIPGRFANQNEVNAIAKLLVADGWKTDRAFGFKQLKKGRDTYNGDSKIFGIKNTKESFDALMNKVDSLISDLKQKSEDDDIHHQLDDDLRGYAWAIVKNRSVVYSGTLPKPEFIPVSAETKVGYFTAMADTIGGELFIGGYPKLVEWEPTGNLILGRTWSEIQALQQGYGHRGIDNGSVEKMPSNAALIYSAPAGEAAIVKVDNDENKKTFENHYAEFKNFLAGYSDARSKMASDVNEALDAFIALVDGASDEDIQAINSIGLRNNLIATAEKRAQEALADDAKIVDLEILRGVSKRLREATKIPATLDPQINKIEKPQLPGATKYRDGSINNAIPLEIEQLPLLGTAHITGVGEENIYIIKDDLNYYSKVFNTEIYSVGERDFTLDAHINHEENEEVEVSSDYIEQELVDMLPDLAERTHNRTSFKSYFNAKFYGTSVTLEQQAKVATLLGLSKTDSVQQFNDALDNYWGNFVEQRKARRENYKNAIRQSELEATMRFATALYNQNNPDVSNVSNPEDVVIEDDNFYRTLDAVTAAREQLKSIKLGKKIRAKISEDIGIASTGDSDAIKRLDELSIDINKLQPVLQEVVSVGYINLANMLVKAKEGGLELTKEGLAIIASVHSKPPFIKDPAAVVGTFHDNVLFADPKGGDITIDPNLDSFNTKLSDELVNLYNWKSDPFGDWALKKDVNEVDVAVQFESGNPSRIVWYIDAEAGSLNLSQFGNNYQDAAKTFSVKVDESVTLFKNLLASNDSTKAIKNSAPWWDSKFAEKYASVYLLDNSKGKDNVTLETLDYDHFTVKYVNGGVGGEYSGSLLGAITWLKSRMQKLATAISGDDVTNEELIGRLKLVKGEDLIYQELSLSEATPAVSAPADIQQTIAEEIERTKQGDVTPSFIDARRTQTLRDYFTNNQEAFIAHTNNLDSEWKNTVNRQLQLEDIEHHGVKIYKTPITRDGVVTTYWAVQSWENVGTDRSFGDSLHATQSMAIVAADYERKNWVEAQERKEYFDKQKQEEDARKEKNRGLTIKERRANELMEKQSNLWRALGLPAGATRAQAMDVALGKGLRFEAAVVQDQTADNRDNEVLDRVSRKGYILGVSNENIPLVKDGLEAMSRLKSGLNKKHEYRIYLKNGVNPPFVNITKTEYDYAKTLHEGIWISNAVRDADLPEGVPVREEFRAVNNALVWADENADLDSNYLSGEPAANIFGEDLEPDLSSASLKIWNAFTAVDGLKIGQWTPFNVMHNDSEIPFMGKVAVNVADEDCKPVIQLVQIKADTNATQADKTKLQHHFELVGHNHLFVSGEPLFPDDDMLAIWNSSFPAYDAAISPVETSTLMPAWMNGSKVQENGKPKILYRGVDNGVDDLIPSSKGTFGPGLYFANEERDAANYGERTVAAYMNLQNPWVINVDYDTEVAMAEDFDHPGVEAILSLPGGRALLDAAKLEPFGHFDSSLQDILKSRGHDGIIATYSDGSQEYVAFHLEQVKLLSPSEPNLANTARSQEDESYSLPKGDVSTEWRGSLMKEIYSIASAEACNGCCTN